MEEHGADVAITLVFAFNFLFRSCFDATQTIKINGIKSCFHVFLYILRGVRTLCKYTIIFMNIGRWPTILLVE